MIIYSEILEKCFDDIGECLHEEFEYKKAKAEAEAKKEADELQEAKEKAYNEAIEACEKYLNLCGIELRFEEDEEDADDEEPDFLKLLLDMLS